MRMQRRRVKSVVQADANAVDAQIGFRSAGNDVEQLGAIEVDTKRGSSGNVTFVNEGFDAANYQPWCGHMEILTNANRQMDRPAFTGFDGVGRWRLQRSSAEYRHPGENRSFDRDGPFLAMHRSQRQDVSLGMAQRPVCGRLPRRRGRGGQATTAGSRARAASLALGAPERTGLKFLGRTLPQYFATTGPPNL
jgi:hypothetical protein